VTPVDLHDRARLALGPRPIEGGLDALLAFHLQRERVSEAVRRAGAGEWAAAAHLLRIAAELSIARIECAAALEELAREADAEAARSGKPGERSRAA
jgi:hypothetical protein